MIKAITIRQPHAEEILIGKKKCENRTWPTKFRGWLLLHAGKTIDRGGENLPTGGFVGAIQISDCIDKGNHFCLRISAFYRARYLIPAKGKLGIFNVSTSIVRGKLPIKILRFLIFSYKTHYLSKQ